LNSNTTASPSTPRGRVRFRRRPHAGHKKPVPAPRPSASSLSLQPTACETAPIAFGSLSLDSRILEGIKDLAFVETRPIQTAVIPLVLLGHDLIACAETGTGKTAAFVVPMLQGLLTRSANLSRSRTLVLAPTRELAVQIEDDIHGLAYHTGITSAAVYGGVEMGPQERALKAGVDIIVATPGRLIDHLRQENADLGAVDLLVLDEADRMMDMGFWPDVRRIIATLPGTRQTLLFSATMPEEVVQQALEITRDAKYVQVGQRSAPAQNITHSIERVAAAQKVTWLIDHLRRS
jgi:ATP-dependent RNA helicase RhlE